MVWKELQETPRVPAMNEAPFAFRPKEWTDAQAAEYADIDSARDPREFLREIYKEANNSEQPPDNRIAKLVMKCSALFVRLSADQEKLGRRLLFLTWVLIVLTGVMTALVGFQIYLQVSQK